MHARRKLISNSLIHRADFFAARDGKHAGIDICMKKSRATSRRGAATFFRTYLSIMRTRGLGRNFLSKYSIHTVVERGLSMIRTSYVNAARAFLTRSIHAYRDVRRGTAAARKLRSLSVILKQGCRITVHRCSPHDFLRASSVRRIMTTA